MPSKDLKQLKALFKINCLNFIFLESIFYIAFRLHNYPLNNVLLFFMLDFAAVHTTTLYLLFRDEQLHVHSPSK